MTQGNVEQGESGAVGAIVTRVEYELPQTVACEMREGVATFVFSVKEHNRRVVVPADVYLALLEELRAKAEKEDQ